MTRTTSAFGEPEVERAVADLATLSGDELRAAFVAHYGLAPPKQMSRDLLVRAVAHRLQVRAYGGPSATIKRRLARLAEELQAMGGLVLSERPVAKPGTRLLRQWGGETHVVTVLDSGYAYRDRRYASLSEIARAITGARWSGPRFFGLTRKAETP